MAPFEEVEKEGSHTVQIPNKMSRKKSQREKEDIQNTEMVLFWMSPYLVPPAAWSGRPEGGRLRRLPLPPKLPDRKVIGPCAASKRTDNR